VPARIKKKKGIEGERERERCREGRKRQLHHSLQRKEANLKKKVGDLG
jgi:hypothetical protein